MGAVVIIIDLIKEFVLPKNTYKRENFWYLLRKGLAYLSYIPITKYYQITRRNKRFKYQCIEYEYLYNLYNATWRNERAVELPIVFRYAYFMSLDRGREIGWFTGYNDCSILEIGNVTSHYTNYGLQWGMNTALPDAIVDKYEHGWGVKNEDIVTFKPKEKYDLVISISTLEHVGIDEEPPNPSKLIEALFNIKKNILKPGGTMLATVPVGYNGCLDQLLTLEPDLFTSIHCMWRKSHRSLDWIEVEWTPHLIKGARVDVKSGYGSTLIAILEMRNEDN